MLSQYCHPEPDLKCLPLAIELKSKGFQVEILTGYPSHPIGKLYSGYKMRLKHTEYIKGIRVNRVPLFIDHSTSAIKRILNYVSFALSASLVGVFIIKKPDVIYAYHAPATIAIPAIFFKLIYGSKIFYDINDYWPDTVSASGMINNKVIIMLISIYCKISYKYFDKINVVSKGFKEKLLKIGVPEDKISLIYNWPLEIKSNKSKTFQHYQELFRDNFAIVYAGNIGKAQSLDIILNTASKLKKNGINDIKFFLVGAGVEKETIEKKIKDEKLQDCIIVTGVIPADNVGEFLNAADVLFLHLKDDPLFEITIPSKLGNYFSMSKPILCGVKGEAAEMVKISKSGLCFESDNYLDLYEKLMVIKRLSKDELTEMGKNGKVYFEEKISFEAGAKNIINVFNVLQNRWPHDY